MLSAAATPAQRRKQFDNGQWRRHKKALISFLFSFGFGFGFYVLRALCDKRKCSQKQTHTHTHIDNLTHFDRCQNLIFRHTHTHNHVSAPLKGNERHKRHLSFAIGHSPPFAIPHMIFFVLLFCSFFLLLLSALSVRDHRVIVICQQFLYCPLGRNKN